MYVDCEFVFLNMLICLCVYVCENGVGVRVDRIGLKGNKVRVVVGVGVNW